MNTSRALNNCHSIADLRDVARRRLPSPVFEFLEGGAESEWTARRNTAAFDDVSLIPRCLVDVSSVRTRTRILGQNIEWPVLCSPTGLSRLFHAEGELAVARAAARAGTLYGLATGSSYSLEAVAAATQGPKWFLLYPYKDRELTRELIARCKRAGYSALCLMVDVPAIGKRERDLRTGFSRWPKWSVKSIASIARRPAWAVSQLRKGPVRLANFTEKPEGTGAISQIDPTITWKDVREFADQWDGPFALKGILSEEDARRAADSGASAIIVSNHGGRQLDGAVAPIEVLPDIARAVGDSIEVILDGGIRRGVHVLKALACGAKACSIGRPYLYGLAAGGEAGVTRALDILRSELVRAMQLSGCSDFEHIDATLVKRRITFQHRG